MRRVVIAIFVFGLLGLAATVGTSWWLAIDLQRSTYLSTGDYPLIWQWPGVLVQRNDARPPEVRERGQNLEYQHMRESFNVPYWSALKDVPDDGSRRVVEVATGWPLKTLRMVGEGDGAFTESVHMRFEGALIGDLALSRFGTRTMPITRLPAKPIWVNLIISVAVWAKLCGLVLNVPRFLRVIRWNLRREKKKCGWCGHDSRMQQSAVCTECGHELNVPPRWLGGPSIVGAVLLLVLLLSAEAMLLVQFLSHQPIQDIHWAAARGDQKEVQRQLEMGADVDLGITYYDYPAREHAEQGVTPLIIACRNRDRALIEALIAAGADLDIAGPLRTSAAPLSIVAAQGDGDLVELFLTAGADPNVGAQGSRTPTPLELAVERGDLALVDRLLNLGADPRGPGGVWGDVLSLAIELDHEAIVRTLLAAYQSNQLPSTSLTHPLYRAVMYDRKYVTMLLDAGAEPNTTGWAPLNRAISQRDFELIDQLLEAGAELSSSAMWTAVREDWYVFHYLLERGGEATILSDLGSSPNYLAELEDFRIGRWLIDAGIDINARETGEGRTALMDAAYDGSAKLVEFLLQHGADPTLRDIYDRTALERVSRIWHPDDAAEKERLLTEAMRTWEQRERQEHSDNVDE